MSANRGSIRARLMASSAALLMWGAGAAWAEDAVGKWTGLVKSPDGDIPFVLNVAKDADGKLTAMGESPAQAPGMKIPADNVTSDGDTLTFDVASVAGRYEGAWDDAKKSWVGIWSQSGYDMPLDLARGE